jgi:hypothetical protein
VLLEPRALGTVVLLIAPARYGIGKDGHEEFRAFGKGRHLSQALLCDRPMDTRPCLLPRVPYTTYHVYLTPRSHVFPPLVHGSISRDYTRSHRATSLYTRLWSIHTTYGHPPSHYVLAPHSFYNYIRIRTHHVSNQHVTVISPDHRHAHISCCIVTVISPRNLLCALDEHTEATFSPSTCASIISPIV